MADARQLKLGQLFEQCHTRRTDDTELLADPRLRAVDPDLDSVVNVNEPAEYRAARERPAPEVTVQRFGALARRGGAAPGSVRAATLQAAAAAVGLELDRHVVAALNGDQITRDPETPLVAGDSVAFLSADAGG
jgi:molybdopterin-guanine dinucleotide biosynthesis protein A